MLFLPHIDIILIKTSTGIYHPSVEKNRTQTIMQKPHVGSEL